MDAPPDLLGSSGVEGCRAVAAVKAKRTAIVELYQAVQSARLRLFCRVLNRLGLTSDYEYMRRVTLDLTGHIPAAQELRDFIADNHPAKRDKLVDHLLASEALYHCDIAGS